MSFLIAGHTKFSPVLLFSNIAQTCNRSDVFTTVKLDWRSVLTKYTKLPGIRSLHEFVFVKNSVTNEVISRVRDSCFEGAFQNSRIHIISG